MSPNSNIKVDPVYLATGDSTESDNGEFSEQLHALPESKGLIIVVLLLALLSSAIYLFIAQPIYSVDSVIQVQEQQGSLGAFDQVADFFDTETAVNAELEILRSRSVIGKVVDKLRLHITARPNYPPIVGAALARRYDPKQGPALPWYGIINTDLGSGFAWGGERIQVETFDVPDVFFSEPFTLVAVDDSRFGLYAPDGQWIADGSVGVPMTGQTEAGPMSLFVSDLVARPKTSFTLMRVSRFIATSELQDELIVSEKGKQSGILELRLEGSDPTKARNIVNEIANVYLRQNVELKSAEAEQTLTFLESQLPVLRDRLEQSESELNTYRLQRGSIDLTKETQVLLETIVAVEADLVTLRQQRDELLRRFTVEHPRVRSVDAQIERFVSKLNELNVRVQKLPDTQQEVLRLTRAVEVDTELYTSLLNSAQELRVVKAGTMGNVRVIDYAVTGGDPVRPQPALVMSLALFAGILLGVTAALLRSAMKRGVDDPEILEKKLGLPVFAMIPHSKAQERLRKRGSSEAASNAVLTLTERDEVAVEAVRSLRTTLHFALLDAEHRVIVVTGPSPGAGKSFVAENLAAVLAQGGERVLLVDGDLRRGRLHKDFGCSSELGVSDVLSGQATAREAILHTEVTDLDVIVCGKYPPNPSDLLMQRRFSDAFAEIEADYDYILVDSPPILAVMDAAAIGQCAGATLMVVRSGTHSVQEIAYAVRRLNQGGGNLKGVVLNDVALGNKRYGYRRYAYSYA